MLWTRDTYLASLSTAKTCLGLTAAVYALKLIRILPLEIFGALPLPGAGIGAIGQAVLWGWSGCAVGTVVAPRTGHFRHSNVVVSRHITGEFGWPWLRRAGRCRHSNVCGWPWLRRTGHWRGGNVSVSPWFRRTGRWSRSNVSVSPWPRRTGRWRRSNVPGWPWARRTGRCRRKNLMTSRPPWR